MAASKFGQAAAGQSHRHRSASFESIQLSDLNGERFIVRTHCETFDSTTKLLAEREIHSRVVYRTDQDDRALALVGAGMGVALMPAIFDAPNVKKVTVRDFDAKRVIPLHCNEDVADDRRDRVVAFATTHNWASSDREAVLGRAPFTPESGPAATLTRSTHAYTDLIVRVARVWRCSTTAHLGQ